jgi:hypothetical protein
MTEKKKTPELSFDEEVDAFLNMDPEERARKTERLMAERIVYYRRKARAEETDGPDSN